MRNITNLINLTPHDVNLNGEVFPKSGQIARVSVTKVQVGTVCNVPVFSPRYGDITDLPDVNVGSAFIVSSLVRTHPSVKNRKDLFSPADLVRDVNGVVIGADGLFQ